MSDKHHAYAGREGKAVVPGTRKFSRNQVYARQLTPETTCARLAALTQRTWKSERQTRQSD